MIDIFFIRHGATEGNLRRRYIGRTDEPLCEAGIAQVKLFTDTTDEDWRRMMAVDMDGAFYACRAVLPGMIHQSCCSRRCLIPSWTA